MNLKALMLVFCMITLTSISCRQQDDDFDCIKEQVLASLKHIYHPEDRKVVDFTIDYTGAKTIVSIQWDFGDGKTELRDSIFTTHTYTDTGTYIAKALIDVTQNGSSCTLTPEKKVVVK